MTVEFRCRHGHVVEVPEGQLDQPLACTVCGVSMRPDAESETQPNPVLGNLRPPRQLASDPSPDRRTSPSGAVSAVALLNLLIGLAYLFCFSVQLLTLIPLVGSSSQLPTQTILIIILLAGCCILAAAAGAYILLAAFNAFKMDTQKVRVNSFRSLGLSSVVFVLFSGFIFQIALGSGVRGAGAWAIDWRLIDWNLWWISIGLIAFLAWPLAQFCINGLLLFTPQATPSQSRSRHRV